MTYDSRPDTQEHIEEVRKRLSLCIAHLRRRAEHHDASKLVEPELSAFNEVTPLLRQLTYGSPEYAAALEALKPALDHHYAANSHHPEHYPAGIDGMDLLDVLEMLCDWKAATMRHADGDLAKSLEINQDRFKISPQLAAILQNTAVRLGWLA